MSVSLSAVASRMLDPGLFQEAYHDLTLVIDFRSPEEYAKGHVRGAIGLPMKRLGTAFGAMAQLILPVSAPLLLVASSPRMAQAANDRLTGQGKSVLGYLEGGVASWRRSGRSLEAFPLRALSIVPMDTPLALIATSPDYRWEGVAEGAPPHPVAGASLLALPESMTASGRRWFKDRGFRQTDRAKGVAVFEMEGASLKGG